MERYWKVTAAGPVAVMLDPQELRASESWVMFHCFEGAYIFENYSRALLCFQEMKAQGSTYFDDLEVINDTLEGSGCGQWELEHATTLYLPHNERARLGYDCITYYRGGWGYPRTCFVKEKIQGGSYGVTAVRVEYASPSEFLALLKVSRYIGGMWRTKEEINN